MNWFGFEGCGIEIQDHVGPTLIPCIKVFSGYISWICWKILAKTFLQHKDELIVLEDFITKSGWPSIQTLGPLIC